MASTRLLTHAHVITPREVLRNAAVLLEGSHIAAIGSAQELTDSFPGQLETTDLGGAYLLPGLIDLHTDTLEKEITPRPAADFPIDIAIQELDRKLVACGITTVYHSLHFGYQEAEWNNRSRFSRREIVQQLRQMAGHHTLAKTRLHARYEIVGLGPETYSLVKSLLDEQAIDLLSFMDHTPGQGQYTKERFVSQRMREGLSEAAALEALIAKQNRPRLTREQMQTLATQAIDQGIPIASHDDDSEEKVQSMHELGVSICEFPINLPAAQKARALGMTVLGGSSNVLRGGSLTGNLDVTAAMKAGAINGLCSDYYPPSMLHATFKLFHEGICDLPAAVAAATLIPAQAAGIDDTCGSIEVGKEADLVVVRMHSQRPVVSQSFVNGECVYSTKPRHAAVAL